MTRLNTSIIRLAAEDIDQEIIAPLQLMIKDAQKNVNVLKSVEKQLKELQDEFFTEIKFIADIVGIAMPEPSEIDLIQDKVYDPLQLIEAYKKEKGIQTDPSAAAMLQEMFAGIEPAINRSVGGAEYRNELIDIIRNVCEIKPEDIHINDVYRNTKEYMELIAKV